MNIYIKAMEIGNDHEKMGISYHNLVDILEKECGYEMDRERKFIFLQWFVENFKCHDSNDKERVRRIIAHLKKQLIPRREDVEKDGDNFDLVYDNWLGLRFFLSGQASKQYVDYLELKEARDVASEARSSSRKSLRMAQWSLLAAILATILPFVYSFYQDSGVKEGGVYQDNYTEIVTTENLPEDPELIKISKNMKLEEFVQLSQLKQYEIVFNEGTYVDDIREEKETFALYSVGTFWVEITYDRLNNEVIRMKPFKEGRLLDKFTIE